MITIDGLTEGERQYQSCRPIAVLRTLVLMWVIVACGSVVGGILAR